MVNVNKMFEKSMPSLMTVLKSFDDQLEEILDENKMQLQVQKEILIELRKLTNAKNIE